MDADKMQGTLVESCPWFGLEPYLEPLRPWRDERLVALALQRWMQRPEPEMVLGRSRPPRLGERPAVDPTQLREVARHLRRVAAAEPSIGPNQAAGYAFGMVRNLLASRIATDYGDSFDVITSEGPPSRTTRRRYVAKAAAERTREKKLGRRSTVLGGEVWIRDSLQYDLDVAALVTGGRSVEAARQWLRDNRGKHAKDAPPARRKRRAG